ncbi:MAG: NAD(P)H:quinone oxidoreductase [Pseudomonadota bacterium]
MASILVLYYSRGGSTAKLASHVARGVESVPGCDAWLRTVPPVSAETAAVADSVPPTGSPYVTLAELERCDGMAYGSPAYFGNMAASMKHFWDNHVDAWLGNALAGKPGAVFTASGSMHGGHEAAQLSMIVPLMHHGMLVVGLPYSETALNHTTGGGTPYGASHVSGADGARAVDETELALARALGARLADTAERLARP